VLGYSLSNYLKTLSVGYHPDNTLPRGDPDERARFHRKAAPHHLAHTRRVVGDHRTAILAEYDPPRRTARRRIDQRAALDAIIFRLRSGCQWNHLPKEFPEDSSVHRTFQRWIELGVLDRIWATSVHECEELGGVNWEWQAADGAMGKARFGGTSSALTPLTEL
jgi:transposase